MQDNMLSYDFIVEYFGKETIEDRYRYLYDKMQHYIWIREIHDTHYISEDVLHQTVMDYFADVYRIKEFHNIEHINIMKIVAYEVYWILRRKPIQIKEQESKNTNIFANEGFCTTFVAHEFLLPNETDPLDESEQEKFIKFLQHLYYSFKYRNIDKQSLETILFSFETGKIFHVTDE